ncbi:MAG TPA: hypothetical protein VMU10_01525 [Desulfomonilia bacterium]|nr:hypothetical protein [Desulfomonilia bacterium]
MLRKSIIATVIIFILWSIVDFILHGLILRSAYADTSQLWRPMEEMSPWIIYLVTAVSACVFTSIYWLLIHEKNVQNAVIYGALFGVGAGVSMGYGSYAAMPITAFIAHAWFLGAFLKYVFAGLVVGAIMKESSRIFPDAA